MEQEGRVKKETAMGRLYEARLRIMELSAALEPFTKFRIERALAEIEASDPWPDDRVLVGYDGTDLTVGMVREARRALRGPSSS